MVEFTKLVEFDMLKPDSMISMFTKSKFKLLDWMQGKDSFGENEEKTILDDMKLYIMAFGVFLMVLCCMCFVMTLRKYRKKIKENFQKLKKMVFFNVIIRSITIVYVQFAISCGFQIKRYCMGDEEQSIEDRLIGLILFIGLFGYPIFAWYIMRRFKDRLEEPAIFDKISNFY